jgi:hypothetical protein
MKMCFKRDVDTLLDAEYVFPTGSTETNLKAASVFETWLPVLQ